MNRIPMNRIPLYPFAFAAAPLVAYFNQNVRALQPADLLRPLLASVVIAAAAVALSWMVVKQRAAALLLSVVLLVSIFAYPLLHDALAALFPGGVRHRFVLPVWCVVMAAAYVVAACMLRRSAGRLDGATRWMNVFAGILCIVLGLPAARFLVAEGADALGWNRGRPAAGHEQPEEQWVEQALRSAGRAGDRDGANFPDIYFIILDGYARGDILETRFGYSNEPFLDFLRDRGFYVADASHCNYTWTHLSLSATLNAEYLQNMVAEDIADDAPADPRARYQYYVKRMGDDYIRTNRVRRFLERLGYTVITGHPGYAVTRHEDTSWAGILFGFPTEFERLVLQRSAFGPVWTTVAAMRPPSGERPKNVTRRLLDQLAETVDVESPKFVFYHVMSPHPPFCFDENGGEIERHPLFEASPWLSDCRKIPGYQDFYRTNYPRNVSGLNIHVKEAMEALLSGSDGEAIIVLQSDHGSQLRLGPGLENTDVPERFGILNAIYLPPGYSREDLTPELSAVNTFPVILRTVFGVDLPNLENRAWYSSGALEFFTEVTERLTDEKGESSRTAGRPFLADDVQKDPGG